MLTKKSLIGLASVILALSAGPVARADYSNIVSSFSPVGYWPLNETNAPPPTVATNLGTLGATGNGLYLGGTVNGLSGALVGDANKAVRFNGTSGELSIPYSPALGLQAPFSAEAWVQPLQATPSIDPAGVLCSLNFNSGRSGWLIYQSGNAWNLRIGNSAGYTFNQTGGTSIVPNTWYHLVAVYDGTNATLYLNGAVEVTGPVTGFTPNNVAPLEIGAAAAVGRYSQVIVDEVAVYTNVLSAADTLAHYQNGINPAPATPYSQLVLAKNPLIYQRMDLMTTNPVAVNLGSLGAVANGSYTFGTTPGVAGPPYSGFGTNNHACKFDPTAAGYVDCGTDPGLNITGPMTLLAWIKGAPADSRFQSFAGIDDSSWRADVDPSGNAHFADGSNTDAVGARNINDGLWHYFAGVYDGASLSVYIDGTLDANQAALSGIGGGTHAMVIGAAGDYLGSRVFKGSVAQVAVIPSALTATDVLQVYYSANIPPSIAQAPASTNASQGASTSFSVGAVGSPTLAYQWRKNGVNLAAQTASTLTLNNVQPADGANYSVVVTNNYGSITSAVAVLTVLTAPTIVQQPQPVTRFAGSNATFTVTAGGAATLTYQWKFNGTTLIPGATTSSYTLSNVQAVNAGSYSCTVSNFLGTATSVGASLAVLPAATGYAAAVLVDSPVAYWRLGETTGTVATDIVDGHNGQYTNVVLGVPGYASPYDTNTAVAFGPGLNSLVGNIQGIDYAASGATATFTLEAWVKGGAQGGDNGIIAKGFGAGGEQFVLDMGGANHAFRFGVRDAGGGFHGAASTVTANGTWQHLVAVCDEPNTVMSLYVNGQAVVSAGISAGLKTVPAGTPVTIGSRQSGQNTPYDLSFNGTIDEVAIYSTALGADRVQAHYDAHFAPSTPAFVSIPPVATTNYVSLSSTFTVLGDGTPPLTYQWKFNGTDIAGATDRTLTLTALTALNAGDYSAAVSNSFGGAVSTTAHLTVLSAPTNVDLSSGLVLHLRFDSDYLDSSGRGNNGTNVGATLVPGVIGTNALHYATDPANSIFKYVKLGLRPDLQFSSNVNFSVAYWIRFPASETQAGDLPILGNAVGSTYQFGYCFSQNFSPTVSGTLWTLWDNVTGVIVAQGPSLLGDGNWHHLAHTFNRAGFATDYVDGIQVTQWPIASAGNLDSGNATVIGQDPSGAYGTQGSADLDDVGMWRRVLSPLEVGAMYVAGLSNGVSFASTPVLLTIKSVGSQVQITWPAGVLESADSVNGPYTTVAGATSPFTLTPSAAKKFYRAKL